MHRRQCRALRAGSVTFVNIPLIQGRHLHFPGVFASLPPPLLLGCEISVPSQPAQLEYTMRRGNRTDFNDWYVQATRQCHAENGGFCVEVGLVRLEKA